MHHDPPHFSLTPDDLLDIFTNGAIGIHFVGPDGVILEANPADLELLGYTREEYIGHHMAEFHVDPPVIEEILTRLSRNETLHNYEARLRAKDGSNKHVLISSNVLWRDGKFMHTRCFTKDVTERRMFEEAVRRSEERYRTFISQTTEGIWRFELEVPVATSDSEKAQIEAFFRFAYLAECNEAMAAMYGFGSAKEMDGTRLAELLPRSDEHNVEYLSKFIRSGYRLIDAESHEIDRSGKTKYFSNNLVGIVDDGKLLRAWGTQRDITAQKAFEEERQRLVSELKDRIQELEIFHDLVVGRELKMIELERQVQHLTQALKLRAGLTNDQKSSSPLSDARVMTTSLPSSPHS
jgi:PAS domain S-box-containing protein